ncbi:MAG: hypothetical protein DMG84_19125 [Acidobacteria bacterium]|nr:MAG: hypothetical protein DMG84_19125 [Acidobacteriota bacterium]
MVATAAAYLGGHLVYEQGIGVDHTLGEALPEKFVPVSSESELADGELKRGEHDDVPILLVRRGKRIFALAEKCSHLGGPLSEGKLRDDSCVPGMARGSLSKMAGYSMAPQCILSPALRLGYETEKLKYASSSLLRTEKSLPLRAVPPQAPGRHKKKRGQPAEPKPRTSPVRRRK